MNFTYPFFLFAFFALLIPVFIHLFNFRKYKSEYFSNVTLLKQVLLKTKKESKLKHLIVLILRMFAISALVLAFTQPFIPNKNFTAQKGSLVSIFVDNSFSMEANAKNGTFLKEATDAAKNIVNAFSYQDDFILITHDFTAKQSHIMNKDEILNEIDMIQISPKSQQFSNILKWRRNMASFSNKTNSIFYFISDFQKNVFDFSNLKQNPDEFSFLVPISNKSTNNVAIDSCWFLSPVFKMGYQATLHVRIRNYSESEVVKLPVKLYVNGVQKSLNAVDIQPNSFADCQLNYIINETGDQSAYIEINDAPIYFDDRFYFVYRVTNNTNVVTIIDKNQNKYLNALYGKDSLFNYSVMDLNQINYGQLKNAELIVLDQLKTVSSGFQDELQKYIQAGGTVLVFPSEELEFSSWNQFLGKLNVPGYANLNTLNVKVSELNLESSYFKGSLADDYKNFEMPSVLKYFKTTNLPTSEEPIMKLENGDRFLTAYKVNQGKIILSAVAMNDQFGNAHKNALMFVPLHNIALMAQIQSKLYQVIGLDDKIVINKPIRNAEDIFSIKSTNSSLEFIPEIKNYGNEIALVFHSQLEKDGFYNIMQDDDTVAVTAFNYNRLESNLNCYSNNELDEIAQKSDGKISILDFQTKDFSKKISESLNGKPLWRWFIILSLLFFLAEVMVLRFWGKVTYKK